MTRRRLRFVKMEGAGNDYVFVNLWRESFPIDAAAPLVRRLSDRHFGVGGDGVIVLAPSDVADVRMLMWNADGSRGAMCGNGIRCLAKLAFDERVVTRTNIAVETDAGVKAIELLQRDGQVVAARVDMGVVRVETAPRHATIAGRNIAYHVGDAGNPHAVVFGPQHPDQVAVAELGAAMQAVAPYRDGVNVEFVQIADGELRQRTFERGSGETLACGSGATVAALAAVRTGRLPGPRVLVHLRGGDLTIDVAGERALMEGPATEVFRGEVDLP